MKPGFYIDDICIFCRSFQRDISYCPIKGYVVDRFDNCEEWEEGR